LAEEGSAPTKFPIQVGSLTTGSRIRVPYHQDRGNPVSMPMRGDKVAEGKSFAPIDGSSGVPRNQHKGYKGKEDS